MGLFDAIKSIGKDVIGSVPGGDIALGVADAIGSFKGAGDADRAAQASYENKLGDMRAGHAQNWFSADDYDYGNRGRSQTANWRRALFGGGDTGAENRLSSSLIDNLFSKWEGRNFDDLMTKTDPSQFYKAPEKRGFFDKALGALATGAGSIYASGQERDRFNKQMDAMKGAYGADRGGAREQGTADAARALGAALPKPQLPGTGLSTEMAPPPTDVKRLPAAVNRIL